MKITSTALLFAFLVAVAANADIDTLISSAEKDASTEAGRKYEQKVGGEFQRNNHSNFANCAVYISPEPLPKEVDLALVFDGKGKVTDAEQKNGGKFGGCLAKNVLGQQYDAPPTAPFTVHFKLH